MEEQIGTRIKKVREKSGLSTISFSKILGISQPSLTALENNKSEPRSKTIIALYEKFNIDPLWLLLGKTQNKITNPESLMIARKLDLLSNNTRQRLLEQIDRDILLEEMLRGQQTQKASCE